MAELKGLILALAEIHQSPRRLLIEANRMLSGHLDTASFITMTYAVVDLEHRTFTYARAGHTPLIHVPGPTSTEASVRVLQPNGMVLGLQIPGGIAKFEELLEESCLSLGAGDLFVLFTDGITEAMNAESDLFGEVRLSRLVEEHGQLPPEELRERVVREIEAFVAGSEQHDDMTMILLKVQEERRSSAGPAEELIETHA